ncbi:hypothetical protein LG324_03625 [Phycicoccus jejuensis]|uniref:hypothetical protein n=1 Tax=Phycicoccus jejuensis TaxID=367299 RepID=UPI0038511863
MTSMAVRDSAIGLRGQIRAALDCLAPGDLDLGVLRDHEEGLRRGSSFDVVVPSQHLRRCVVIRALLLAAADTSRAGLPPVGGVRVRRRFLMAALEVVEDLVSVEAPAPSPVPRHGTGVAR